MTDAPTYFEADDSLLEISSHHLRKVCDEGELTLYPAKYWLVCKNGKGDCHA